MSVEIKLTGSYWIHPDLPNYKIYAKSVDYIPAKKGIDKSKYILCRRNK